MNTRIKEMYISHIVVDLSNTTQWLK